MPSDRLKAKRKLTASQLIAILSKRVTKLERELKVSREVMYRAVHDAIQDGLAEQASWNLDRLVTKAMGDVEQQLLRQIQPHMVEVRVNYKGLGEPGDEFTVRA